MIRKIMPALLLFGLGFGGRAAAMQTGTPTSTKSSAQEAQKQDPLGRFRWLTASGDARALVLENRKLESLRITAGNPATSETETEVTRPDANSMRTTRRVYDRGPNGERLLVEVVVEDLSAGAGDRLSATKTVSRRDANGRLQLALRQTQETIPTGPDTFQTRATTMTQGTGTALAKSEELVQTEKKKPGGVVEIDRSQLLPDGNGGWTTAARRVSSSREANEEIISQEEVYGMDAGGRLSLLQRQASREWKDPQGNGRLDKDTYQMNPAGTMELYSRSNLVRVASQDGGFQTIQTVLQRNPLAPSEGLKLAEKILQSRRTAGAGTTENELEVQTVDVNGRLQATFYRKDIEKK